MQPYGPEEQLAELRHHWGDAYVIEHTSPDRWLAKRRDEMPGWLICDSAGELMEAISADYTKCPVPRDVEQS